MLKKQNELIKRDLEQSQANNTAETVLIEHEKLKMELIMKERSRESLFIKH